MCIPGSPPRTRVVIAGAFGFIGQHLTERLIAADNGCEIWALSRRQRRASNPRLRCLQVDLYDLDEAKAALQGADAAIYLVHSMAPHSRLMQGAFRDFDFILADNFAQAAKAGGIKHLIYVGGIVPRRQTLSLHLKSRLEVEATLAGRSVGLTALRCGLVIGRAGTSFTIIANLVHRLPILPLPLWLQTPSQPVDIRRLTAAIEQAIADPVTGYRVVDIAGPEPITHEMLVRRLSKILARPQWIISIPVHLRRLSRTLIWIFSGASRSLVYPLLGSIDQPMLPSHPPPPSWTLPQYSLDDSLRTALRSPLRRVLALAVDPDVVGHSEVRSIQRLPHRPGRRMLAVARLYQKWLPSPVAGILRVQATSRGYRYVLRGWRMCLIELQTRRESCTASRHVFQVVGGALAGRHGQRGELEFRAAPDHSFAVALLHRFRPALPWVIYRLTQAVIHRFVMGAFARRLAERDRKQLQRPSPPSA